MKIAILTPTFSHFSGIDRIVEMEEIKYTKEGHKVDIFTLKATIKPRYARIFELGMPKNHFLERLYRLLFFLDFKKIKKYVKILEKYDIIISHLYPMNILAYKVKKKNKKIEYIYHNAGVGIAKTYSTLEKIYLKLFNLLNNLTIKNCDKAISISNFLKNELKKETGIDSKVEYIKIDKKRFNKKIDKKKIRRRYNIKKNEPLLLYVGRISPHKGIHILIKSFKLVQKEYPNSKLIIVGKHTFPKYTKKLKKISNKDIIFTGFIPDEELPYYYAACDVYTTTSLWEGFDIPIVEANSIGKPAVAFDIGSHSEVLKKGILVKKIDAKEFAKAIIKILKSPNLYQ